jgi:hypothetical protein
MAVEVNGQIMMPKYPIAAIFESIAKEGQLSRLRIAAQFAASS